MLAGSLARTSASTGGTLVISLNYGAQAEIAAAARRLAVRTAAGDIGADAIDEAAIEAELDTAGLPPLDLLIRTSGERRAGHQHGGAFQMGPRRLADRKSTRLNSSH